MSSPTETFGMAPKFERKKTTMKKMYVKPMASGVAFVVNENIATSKFIQVEGWGSFDYNADGVLVINSTNIPCRIPEGGSMDLMTALTYCTPDEYLIIKSAMDAGTFNCY
jgi:hypothetical protein